MTTRALTVTAIKFLFDRHKGQGLTLRLEPYTIDDQMQGMHHSMMIVRNGEDTDITLDIGDDAFVACNQWKGDAMHHLYEGVSPQTAINAAIRALGL